MTGITFNGVSPVYAEPLTGNEWQQWCQRMWNQIARGGYPGLAPLEQYMRRSLKEKRCIDCGEPGTVYQESVIVPAVAGYYFCPDCAHYWEHKYDV